MNIIINKLIFVILLSTICFADGGTDDDPEDESNKRENNAKLISLK